MTDGNGPIARFIKKLTKVEPNELQATVLSVLFVFILFAAYFIVRPVRDAMASDWSRVETTMLWNTTFFVSIIAVSLYGGIISRMPFRRVVPSVYVFFTASFAAFYFGSSLVENPTNVDKAFYVWLSIFSLFHASVFWTFMSGLFSSHQAMRLFAIIMTGASLGAIVGPVIPAFFTQAIGTMNLMLVSAVMLLLPIPIIARLEKLKVTKLGNADLEADLSQAKRLGKNPFSGFMLFVKNPYLLAIGIFILMYVTMSTFVYMEMREMLAIYDRAERTEILARIDLAINSLAFLCAIFLTGRFVTRFGMAITLGLIPLLMVGGWMIVALVPLLGVLYGLQIARRAGNYAVTKPGREMLFTVVDDETRYKAKPVIDIVVYRGGDMLTANFHLFLKEFLTLGLSGVAIVAAVIAGIWAAAGVYLGRRFNEASDAKPEKAAPSEA